MKKYIDNVINKFTKYMSDEIASNNIDFINGKAHFINAKTIEVINKNQTMVVGFDKLIVASGSVGRSFNLPNNVRLLRPDNIFSLETFPKSVTIIGGGFVGCEFAVFFKRIGVDTTIVEKTDRLLSDFEEQIVKKLEDKFRKDGISIIKNVNITHIDKIGNKAIIFCENGQKIESEQVFIAIGRRPNIDFLDLDKADIEFNNNVPQLNKSFQTTNNNVYIIGDASGVKSHNIQ